MINILTDSTADIPKELCKSYQIETIPVYIQLNGRVYKDGEDIYPEMLFDTVRKTGRYPTTSAPSPNDFVEFFNRETPSIYIGLSSQLSTAGQFIYTLTAVDVATGWAECLAIPNKTQIAVSNAIKALRLRLPFPLLGIDCDNGSEFINDPLCVYNNETTDANNLVSRAKEKHDVSRRKIHKHTRPRSDIQTSATEIHGRI
jgi:hypothetical protein